MARLLEEPQGTTGWRRALPQPRAGFLLPPRLPAFGHAEAPVLPTPVGHSREAPAGGSARGWTGGNLQRARRAFGWAVGVEKPPRPMRMIRSRGLLPWD